MSSVSIKVYLCEEHYISDLSMVITLSGLEVQSPLCLPWLKVYALLLVSQL